MPKHLSIAALFVIVVQAAQSIAGESDRPDPLFAGDELVEITIEAPFSIIMRDRVNDEDTAAVFRYSDPAGTAIEFDIGVRARGEFRRNPDVCEFAPLRLNFKKSQLESTLFEHQDKLKLVTHCQTNSPKYDQFVISEYLAYRFLNLVADLSFRVRLARINYIDTADGDRAIARLAMFIEHRDRLATRTSTTTVHTERVKFVQLDHVYTNLISVFHYFIGNTDYSPIAPSPGDDCCHNHTLFADKKWYFSVPYDFDLAGLIDTPYAISNPRFKLRNVRQRRYRGRCFNNFYVTASVARFFERRDDIYRLINEQELMTDRTRRKMLRYVDDFFESLSGPEKIRSRLIENCA
jgi:hypothetical protein